MKKLLLAVFVSTLLASTAANAFVTEVGIATTAGEEVHYVVYDTGTTLTPAMMKFKVGDPASLTLNSTLVFMEGNATPLGARLHNLETATASMGTSAFMDVPAAGDASTGEVVRGNDSRLTDSRAPMNHNHVMIDISDSTMLGRAILGAANAAAVRSAIGASTFDGSYGSLIDVPATFTPASHVHSTADITSGTFADSRIAQSNVTQHQGAMVFTSAQVTSGTMNDSRIAQSNITQHQAALSIGTSQLTGTLADARVAASNVTQYQASLSIATSQLTGTKTNTFISDFQTAARAAFTAGTNINISSGVISASIPVSAGTSANAARALNTCFRISATNDADFHYSVDVTAALVLGGGTATITSYTDSGCSTGSTVLRDGTLSGVVSSGTTSVNLDGTLLAGKYAKITTATTGIGASVAIRAAQQEFIRP